ncbi:DUF2378 family protein [Archangium primigenium]|uniref:DUF2378 family protein n=1 Tax=[Archangium] primigenium TaxID=2792470 RepID=UPI0019583C27|nr:DUF2378 family protein [Archangium primigenium]
MSDAPREWIVFDYTMESLLRVLGQPLLPEHVAGLMALGVNPRRLEPAFPVAVYIRVLDFIGQQLWPGLSREEAAFAVGRAFMVAYRQTLMGKAVFSITRVIGPHRALDRMSRNFRSANNYTETRLTPLGPNRYALWFNHATNTGFFRGLLTEALEGIGVRGLSVTLMDSGGQEPGATFLVSWSE